MIYKRAAEERGHFDHGWLKTYHTFSFADYFDERFMGFGPLRVINEDYVAAGQGFGMHPHRDMEIITYILEGELEHKDSMGTGSVIRPGEVQQMSAGTGVFHSEFNPSKEHATHLLQIWIMPNERGAKPRYQQKAFTKEERKGKLKLVAAPDPIAEVSDVIGIHQDTRVYASILDPEQVVSYELGQEKHAWLHVAKGVIDINGTQFKAGDGAAISEEDSITIKGLKSDSEFLLFDLG